MISTHVLDTARGRPAAGIAVVLEVRDGDGWRRLGAGTTDADGRVTDLVAPEAAGVGDHRLTFDTAGYAPDGFFPQVSVVFNVTDPGASHHVPLLLSPYGYTTYRGS